LLLEKESSLLNQKTRIKRLKQWDTISTSIRWRRIKNELNVVDMNGMWCENPFKIREEVRQVFEK